MSDWKRVECEYIKDRWAGRTQPIEQWTFEVEDDVQVGDQLVDPESIYGDGIVEVMREGSDYTGSVRRLTQRA